LRRGPVSFTAGVAVAGVARAMSVLTAMALEPAVADWFARRTYEGSAYSLQRLLEHKREPIALILPTRNVGETIGAIVDALVKLRTAGLVDELLVIDADSRDGTATIARRSGATIAQESELLPEHGAARGKGDAMWRGLSATSAPIVAYLDTDTEDFDPTLALGLLGPLLVEQDVTFVKGAFGRPFRLGAETIPDGGGRVTELLARPLINLHFPQLAGFVQPLAGETAARRELLEALPFAAGYGVELALLVDALRAVGLERLAQVNLGVRQNRHQPLSELGAMAYEVLVAAERRLAPAPALAASERFTRPHAGALDTRTVAVEERPPLVAS
jgi:glucosyl-3-phosphoglycerate synthase